MKLSLKKILKEVELSDEEIEKRAEDLADPKGELRWEIQRLTNELEQAESMLLPQKEIIEKGQQLNQLQQIFWQRRNYFQNTIESGEKRSVPKKYK